EERARRLREWLGRDEGRRAASWASWRSIFLTDKGEPRSAKMVAPAKVRQRWPDAYEAFLAEADRIRAIEERLAAAELAEASAALAALAAPAIAGFASAKAARAGLDYDDLIARTRALLEADGAAAWVHYKLDQGVDHVLIDEAQDTNSDQWAIVGRLTEEFFVGEGARPLPRTVFAVGDEKQSIYGFQGAEPAEFARWKGIFARKCGEAGLAWRAESLTRSFRSVPAVLALVDAVFDGPAGAGLTAEGGPVRHEAARRDAAGSAELWPVVSGAREEPPEDPWAALADAVTERDPARALAEAIAARIRTWIDGGEVLPARGRPIRPGDVMILVRTRDRFVAELVRALKARGVPVSGLDRLKLTASLAVQDLLALCRVALLPEADELSLAEVLRGPFCDVSEESLFALCRHPADVARPRPGRLWDMLRARRGERPEWQEAAALIEAVARRADLLRPAELLGFIL
ncbi:MAG: UvrD-helicase domain-containing protein, partial [Elioraea sp.]|nr:UvrD-helicase domain-containing protein [Elioraea sp.]